MRAPAVGPILGVLRRSAVPRSAGRPPRSPLVPRAAGRLRALSVTVRAAFSQSVGRGGEIACEERPERHRRLRSSRPPGRRPRRRGPAACSANRSSTGSPRRSRTWSMPRRSECPVARREVERQQLVADRHRPIELTEVTSRLRANSRPRSRGTSGSRSAAQGRSPRSRVRMRHADCRPCWLPAMFRSARATIELSPRSSARARPASIDPNPSYGRPSTS